MDKQIIRLLVLSAVVIVLIGLLLIPPPSTPKTPIKPVIDSQECRAHDECASRVCDYYKQDMGNCAPLDCTPGQTAAYGEYLCDDNGGWVKTGTTDPCANNPFCGLKLPCDDGLVRVLEKDQYGPGCVETMAQVVLPTICVACGDGVCDKKESICNCPDDCAVGDQRCATFSRDGEEIGKCATCGDNICDEFEKCVPSNVDCRSGDCIATSDCGGLYCPEDCTEVKIEVDYSCGSDIDCVSTCGEGCVNRDWAQGYKDTCVNVRAWDCTCVEGKCYTDGNAPDAQIFSIREYKSKNRPLNSTHQIRGYVSEIALDVCDCPLGAVCDCPSPPYVVLTDYQLGMPGEPFGWDADFSEEELYVAVAVTEPSVSALELNGRYVFEIRVGQYYVELVSY